MGLKKSTGNSILSDVEQVNNKLKNALQRQQPISRNTNIKYNREQQEYRMCRMLIAKYSNVHPYNRWTTT